MKDLPKDIGEIGINLTVEQNAQFSTYLDELKSWNKRTNLTAIEEDNEIISKHFFDSLSVLRAIPENAGTLADVGTGAGFPGLPIKIARPNLKVTLIESVGKKVEFLKHIVQILKLEDVEVIQERAEEVGRDRRFREQFDVVTARAVAALPTLCEYALPLLRVGGVFVAQKGATPESGQAGEEEILGAQTALEILGGKIVKKIPIYIEGVPARQLIVIEKIKPTPVEYPRRRPDKPIKK